jgi:hypothetical protein
MDRPSDDDARARIEGKRIAHVVVIVVAVLFIGASAAQIIPAVFGWGIRPLAAGAPGSAEDACGEGVRAMERALDRAGGLAWSSRGLTSSGGAPLVDDDPTGGEAAMQVLRAGLAPEWDAEARVERACAGSRGGSEAWAALMRLRRAEEQLVFGAFVELAVPRGDVASHLPADLR